VGEQGERKRGRDGEWQGEGERERGREREREGERETGIGGVTFSFLTSQILLTTQIFLTSQTFLTSKEYSLKRGNILLVSPPLSHSLSHTLEGRFGLGV